MLFTPEIPQARFAVAALGAGIFPPHGARSSTARLLERTRQQSMQGDQQQQDPRGGMHSVPAVQRGHC
eukprot:261910-Pyramimonas_sp.AAC.1